MGIQKIFSAIFTTVVVSAFLMPQALASVKSPSHVYQNTARIVAEIQLVRQAMNVTDTPRDPGVQVKKKPLHVYSKSLELLEKISRAQIKKGMSAVTIGQIPLKKIIPADVFNATETILKEVRRLKSKLGVTTTITDPPFVAGKKPSDVYENMWRASYMMDGVAGQINPSNVYRNTQIIAKELEIIASKKGISLNKTVPAIVAGKKPKDVNLQGFKNMHHIVKLQRKLKVDPMRVPTFPPGKITPSDVYDTTYNIIAEIVRIKVALGIDAPQINVALAQGKTPPMVLAQMQLIGKYLETMHKGL